MHIYLYIRIIYFANRIHCTIQYNCIIHCSIHCTVHYTLICLNLSTYRKIFIRC